MKLFYNARIIASVQDPKPYDWLVVKDEKIVHRGRGTPDRSHSFTQKIDLGGKVVFPGWIDAHCHLSLLGRTKIDIDVSDCESPKALQSKIRCALHDQEWIEAFGLNPVGWTPSRKLLDQISSHHLIVVRRKDEHAIWVNSKLLSLLGLDGTGGFIDRACEKVYQKRPKPTLKQRQSCLLEAQRELLKYGITSVHDLSMGFSDIAPLKQLVALGDYHLRTYGIFDDRREGELFAPDRESTRLSIETKKIFIDGALGSRGAWLLEPYSDYPQMSGHCQYEEEELKVLLGRYHKQGFRFAFHVLGDRSSLWILDILENLFSPLELKKQRVRLEHLEIVDPGLFLRMKKNGIIASVQPSHLYSDVQWLKDRLGEGRLKNVMPLRSFLSHSIPLCGGSDAPIESPNPLRGIAAAQSCVDPGLSRLEAITLFTETGAFAEFLEHRKGKLDIGYDADFCVFSKDLLSVPSEELLHLKNELTVIGGEIVYEG